jgi:hypothetical protein
MRKTKEQQSEPPALMTARNHVDPLDGILDEHFIRLPEKWRTEDMRLFLHRFGSRVLNSARWAFAKGAERGIIQAMHLMESQEYYEKKKEQGKAQRAAMVKQQQEHEKEREQFKTNPSPDQIDNRRAFLQEQISYHQVCIVNQQAALAEWNQKFPPPQPPKNVVPIAPRSRRINKD